MNNGILIVGAGGHGKVIADILMCNAQVIYGFLDDDFTKINQKILGFPVVGKSHEWHLFEAQGLILGIGDNQLRCVLAKRIEEYSLPTWLTAIHPTSVVAKSVRWEEGSVIMANAVVNAGAKVGKHSIINTGATVDHDCVIGDFVHVAPGSHIAGGVEVSNGVLLGIGCTVLPGCKIGEESIVGAGAVVTKDVPPKVIVKGIPAR